MPKLRTTGFVPVLALGLGLGLGLACTGAVRAETGPYLIGVSETLSHETNLLRRPEGQPSVADTSSTTTLLAGFDRGIGRQRVYFNGSARRTVYRDNSVYDNTGYQVSTGLDWSTANRISGSLGATASRSLAPFGFSGIPSEERNIQTARQFNAAARIGGVTPLTLEGTFARQQVDYSGNSFQFAVVSQNAYGLNLLYRTSPQLTIGPGIRLTRGEYPRPFPGAFSEDRFEGRNVDLALVWVPSAVSTLTGRVGHSRLRHDGASQRDFSGVTANVQWVWRPAFAGKWRLTSQYARATGADATFNALFNALSNEVVGVTSTYGRISDTAVLNASYAATGKITVDATFRQEHRRLSRSFDAGGAPVAAADMSGSDDTRTVGLLVRYDATRTLQFNCGVGRTRRTTSTALSYPYATGYASCTAQLALQP